VLMVGPAQWDE